MFFALTATCKDCDFGLPNASNGQSGKTMFKDITGPEGEILGDSAACARCGETPLEKIK